MLSPPEEIKARVAMTKEQIKFIPVQTNTSLDINEVASSTTLTKLLYSLMMSLVIVSI